MASNKHVDLRKIENFVRSKENRTNFRKPCKNFKIVDQHLTSKGKEGWHLTMIEKITIALYFTVNPILIYEIWIASKVSRLNALT